jgi:hypothetical protein
MPYVPTVACKICGNLYHEKTLEYVGFDTWSEMVGEIVCSKCKLDIQHITSRDCVNKMLGDVGKLEKHFDRNHEPLSFIKDFRKDLNILFEILKDDEEDFRRNLVVLLLDIVDQVNIYKFKEQELVIIKDMTMSLLANVTGEKLDYYISLAIEKNMYTVRIPNYE